MEPLNVDQAVALGAVVNAVQRKAKVARLIENGDVVIGTARSVGDINGAYAASHEDVRDCYLRVTAVAGFECFWPIRQLIEDYSTGVLVLNYKE